MSGDSPNDGLSESAILIFQIFNGKIQIFNEIFWTMSFVKVVKGKNLRIDHTDKSPIHWKALKSREHVEKGPLPVGGHLEKMKKFGNCPIRKSRRVRAFHWSNAFFNGHFRPHRKSKNKMADAKWLPHRWAIRICNKKKSGRGQKKGFMQRGGGGWVKR